MSYPAILIPDHFEVGLVRSNSGLTGKTKQIIDLNGGHIQSHHQMRGAGGIAKVNDLGLMSLIGIEKTLLLRGVITQSDDNHEREHSTRIDTAIIRSLGANIVNAGPIIEAIQNLPSIYIEQLTSDQQTNIPKIFDQLKTILNLNAVSALPHAENIIAKQIDEALGDLLNTITETFPSFAPEFQNIFLSVLKTVEPIAIKHNASVDIQNSMSILEESIVQFIDLANKNSIKFDNDNFSVAIPFDVVDLKISEHDPKNEILDQDIAQQDIISDAPNDESSDTIITPDTIDDINIVDTDIDLESKSEHNLELLKPESETLIEIVLSDQDITQGNLTIEVETNNLEAMPEHTLELQGITAENIEAIILPDQEIFQIDSTIESIFDKSEIESNSLDSENTQSLSEGPDIISEIITEPTSVSQDLKILSATLATLTTPTIIQQKIYAPLQTTTLQTPSAAKPISIAINSISASVASHPILLPQYPAHIRKILPTLSITQNIPISNIKPLFATTVPTKIFIKQPIIGAAPAKSPIAVTKQPLPLNTTPIPKSKDSAPSIFIQKRINAIPQSLKKAQVIIQSILKSDPQRNITIQAKPANNNKPTQINVPTPHKPSAALPLPAHQPKPPIPATATLFKDASKITITPIKAKIDDFYLQIKRNPAVKAVCAISGGICRCSEQFNKAVRGLITDPVKKLLNEKNISETEYINDARAQVKISESIEALSRPDEQQISEKDNERLLNMRKDRDTPKKSNENGHIHGPWCEHASPPERAKIAATILPSQQISNESSSNTETKTLTARELRALVKNQSQLNVK
jgi:hypothetical protein